METKSELYRAAMRAVSARRGLAQQQAEARLTGLRTAVPEYEPLRRTLLKTQFEKAKAAASGADKEALAALDEKLGALLRRQEQLLTLAGVTPADLVPAYRCPLCGDTGCCGGKRCVCVEKEMRRLRREQINRESPLALSEFSRFSLDKYSAEVQPQLGTSPRAVMTQVLEYCRAFAAHFKPGCGSLLMMGDAGLGKTHLALAIAQEVLDKGYDVVYVSAQQAFAAIDNLRAEGGAQWLEAMLEADLLILDDLGTEYIVPHTISVLYQIVNTRLSERRPTVYTTNIVTQQLMNSRYTEKVASRLLGGCEILQFFGEDIRLQDK